jgi:hypothetical protein
MQRVDNKKRHKDTINEISFAEFNESLKILLRNIIIKEGTFKFDNGCIITSLLLADIFICPS